MLEERIDGSKNGRLLDLGGFITPFSLLCVSEIKILMNTCV